MGFIGKTGYFMRDEGHQVLEGGPSGGKKDVNATVQLDGDLSPRSPPSLWCCWLMLLSASAVSGGR